MHGLRTIHRAHEDGSTFVMLVQCVFSFFLCWLKSWLWIVWFIKAWDSHPCLCYFKICYYNYLVKTVSVRIKLKPANELVASTSISSSLAIIYLLSYNFSQFRCRFWKEMKWKLTQSYWSRLMYHTGQTLYCSLHVHIVVINKLKLR